MLKERIQSQANLLLVAVSFFTRLPVDRWAHYNAHALNESARYFPWVGWLVGGLCAFALWLAAQILPMPIAVLISMAIGLLITGAFHEDGFADTCDGLGGGWNREQALTIMKDSRLGTYGSAGLLIMLALKATALSHFSITDAVVALLAAHVMSRFIAMNMIGLLPYVRDDSSKAKPLAYQITHQSRWIASLAVLPCLLFFTWPTFVVLAAILALVLWHLIGYFRTRLGGYTGDCLGATQQVAEICVYLTLLVAASPNFA